MHRRLPCQRVKSWEQRSECLASPLSTQEREASDARASDFHSEREDTSLVALLSLEHNPLLRSHTRKSSRDRTSSRERQLIHERRRADRKEGIEFLQLREQQALRLEQEARQQVFDMEFNTRTNLEEQRCAIVDQADFQLNIQEAKSENLVQISTQQLPQQQMELSSRS